jgi:5-hydroxyisourate hydrolase
MPGRLTTHVLDTACGRPAAGLRLVLRRAGSSAALAETVTDADGRCTRPLLEGDALRPGVYELAFHVGAYFRDRGVQLPDPSFLDVVPVRFGIADAAAHYHVPLLVSPYGYATYRGS